MGAKNMDHPSPRQPAITNSVNAQAQVITQGLRPRWRPERW